jgi:membrane protein YdbS with pleckstrin-like domain
MFGIKKRHVIIAFTISLLSAIMACYYLYYAAKLDNYNLSYLEYFVTLLLVFGSLFCFISILYLTNKDNFRKSEPDFDTDIIY